MKKSGFKITLLTIAIFCWAHSAAQASVILDKLSKFGQGVGYTSIANPETGKLRLAGFIGEIISFGLGFLGVIFMLLIIYSGILWMTARGNEQQVDKAKKTLESSVVGILIVTAAYAVVKTVSAVFTYLGYSI